MKATEIKGQMMQMGNEAEARHLSRFFKTDKGQYGEGDKFLGIRVPVTRQIVKENWQECPLEDIEALVSDEYHELRLCALLLLVQMFKHAKKNPSLQQEIVNFYLSHTQYINNWDLVDLSCYEILGPWLMDRDRTLLYDLARNGKTMWEQRIGMVSCMAFVRKGQCDDLLAIADILLFHEHDLLHKAVGWLLREVDKKNPALLRAYLLGTPGHVANAASPRYKVMPRTTLRYAIEKFPEPERLAYLHGAV